MKRLLPFILALATTLPLLAAEGKWTPQQVLELDPAWLKEQGLQLPPARLWDAKRGTGLLSAAISTGGCSAGFISAEGLFITNHHCLHGVVQEHATPQNDILTNGFVARSRDAELRSKVMRVTMPRRFVDVTKDVLTAVPRGANDTQRHQAIEAKMSAIVAACEKQPATRCTVAGHDGGVQYVLQEATEFDDVRLVYSPPRAIGEYGGEIDNWLWPRHTGDFAIGRVYVNGAPYKPEFFFPLAKDGVKSGDFVMVLGYPGMTYRSLTAAEMEERQLWFQRRASIYREWIALLEETTRGSAEGAIAVADVKKTLANRQKNAEGQLAGFTKWELIAKQRAVEKATPAAAPAAGTPGPGALQGLADMAKEKLATFDRDFLLDHLRMTPATLSLTGPRSLILAVAVARASTERAKPDAQRDPVFQERSIGRVRDRVEREQKNFYAPSDKAHLTHFLNLARNLPADQRIAALDSITNVEQLYATSKLLDLNERMKMFSETPAQLRARRDPLIEAGFALNAAIDEMAARKNRWEGTISRLRPEWRRSVMARTGKPLAPDANGTLRVSFAHVKGYEPRDGVWYNAQTTLHGLVEKHRNEEPFDVPDNILAAAQGKQVIVNFLADGDTGSGSSGSPVLNGRGELVGVNFDRVWENVANDFGYLSEAGRNISADVRYLLWMLAEVEKAENLLRELGVKP